MQRKTHLFDANTQVLGRLSVEIARVLSGRDAVDFAPHVDAGARVVVINARKVVVTGNKRDGKIYYRHTGFPGGIKQRTFREQIDLDPREVIVSAVKGMLPKNKLQAKMLGRLFVFSDAEHNQTNIDIDHTK